MATTGDGIAVKDRDIYHTDRGRKGMAYRTCSHLDWIRDPAPRTHSGCEECLASGEEWVHLRVCLTCGHVGCCDASRNRHASEHFAETQHPIIRSLEPGERWSWCYLDEGFVDSGDWPTDDQTTRAASTTPDASAPGAHLSERPGGLFSRLIGSLHRHRYIVGVIDDPVAAQRGAHALKIYGFPARDVVLQTGDDMARQLALEEVATRLREATSEEGSICLAYNEMARQSTILSVHTPTAADRRRACHILTAYGAHSMLHFGEWDISEVVPGEGCWT